MNCTIRTSALAVGLSIGAAASAQTLDYGALQQLFGEPVTASVTGSPQRESEVAATMLIITADDIRRSGARDVPGVLRHFSGVDVLQSSNDHADVSVRGYNQMYSPRLLVLVDGRQVYADYYGFTPWSTVPVELDAIRQIEVVKGPNSALFGFNAVGGVINIVTFGPLDDDAASGFGVRAGTQDLVQATGVSTLRLGERAGLRLMGGHSSNDDFDTALRSVEVGTRRGNERNAFNLTGAVDLPSGIRFGAEGTYSDARQPELSPLYEMVYASYHTRSLKAFVTADTKLGALDGMVYWNHIEADDYFGASPTSIAHFDNNVRVAQLRSISKIGGAHTLRLSLEFRENTLDVTPLTGAQVFYDTGALGGMWEWQLDDALSLTTALRVDRWSLGREGVIPPGLLLSNEDWDRTRSESSFNSGLVWLVSERDSLRFMIGRGVQLPNLMNLGGLLAPSTGTGWFGGVPELPPIEVTNYEISWDRRLDALDAVARFSVFSGRTSDVVAIVGGARPSVGLNGTPAAIGDSSTTGFEASINGRLAERWRWSAGYIRQNIDDDLNALLPFALTLIDFESTTPRATVKAGLGWSSGPWEVDGYLRHQTSVAGIVGDSTLATGGRLEPIGRFAALDGRLGYAVNDRMTVALSGENLTRGEQRQGSGPAVERRVRATFTWDL